MYYSRYYHQIIPKPIFLDIQQVEKVKERKRSHMYPALSRPFNWQKPNNQMFQPILGTSLGLIIFLGTMVSVY